MWLIIFVYCPMAKPAKAASIVLWFIDLIPLKPNIQAADNNVEGGIYYNGTLKNERCLMVLFGKIAGNVDFDVRYCNLVCVL
jgi:hypothetical protein